MDLNELLYNLTYNDHFRLAVYEDCTPCPARYICDEAASTCSSPSPEGQNEHFQQCLRRERTRTCYTSN
eukprot:10784390-Karenia_brevis.AAC.1